jgi:hypothetical protein
LPRSGAIARLGAALPSIAMNQSPPLPIRAASIDCANPARQYRRDEPDRLKVIEAVVEQRLLP